MLHYFVYLHKTSLVSVSLTCLRFLSFSCSPKAEDFDLEGMDQSWNSSQLLPVSANRESDDSLPQLDGTGDDKTGTMPK